jgi:hypothetical protein
MPSARSYSNDIVNRIERTLSQYNDIISVVESRDGDGLESTRSVSLSLSFPRVPFDLPSSPLEPNDDRQLAAPLPLARSQSSSASHATLNIDIAPVVGVQPIRQQPLVPSCPLR